MVGRKPEMNINREGEWGAIGIAASLVGMWCYNNFSYNTRTIRIDKTYIVNEVGGSVFYVRDQSGNIYTCNNSFFSWFWKEHDIWSGLKPGDHVTITTTGYRNRVLQLFPNIVGVKYQ